MKLLTLLSILFISYSSFGQETSQYPLKDAGDYYDFVQKKEYAKASAILKKYNLESNNGKYVSTRFIAVNDSVKPEKVVQPEVGDAESGPGAAGLAAPEMIDEIAKIIADRFREELTIAFLDNFRQKLRADPILGEVFPNARRVLLYDDPFNYESWLASFRTALNLDLQGIPDRLPEILRGITTLKGVTLTAEQKELINSVISIYEEALPFIESPQDTYQNTVNLMNLLTTQFKTKGDSLHGVDNALKVITPLVTELCNSEQTDWAASSMIKRLETPKILQLYIGFTCEKYKSSLDSVKVNLNGDTINVYQWAHAAPDSVQTAETEELKTVVRDFARLVREIEGAVVTIQNKIALGEEKLHYNDYVPLMESGFDLVSFLTSEKTLKTVDNKIKLSQKFKNVSKGINEAVPYLISVNGAIADQDYAEILVSTLKALEEFVPEEVLEDNLFLKDVLKYGNLAVTISSAKTPEEFSEALKGAILPAQSYRLKRNAHFSVTANAYAGPFGAAELLMNKNAQNPLEGTIGFTAPIGIGLNWAITQKNPPKKKYSVRPTKTIITMNCKDTIIERKRYFSGHSISLFVSVVDIGAVVAYRLKDDHSPAANVQWRNILAPGAYVSWGIGNSPLSLNLGVQYGPELRSVDAVDNLTDENNQPITTISSRAWRVGGALTVDIPLFNFYSRSEKVKMKD